MRKLGLVLIAALVALTAWAQWEGEFGEGGSGGGAGGAPSVSAVVAVDGAWPIVTASVGRLEKQYDGYGEYELAVHVPELDLTEVFDTAASKQRVSFVPALHASVADSFRVVVVAYVAEGDSQTVYDRYVHVRRGGGAGIEVEIQVDDWGETPYLDVLVDLGYPVELYVGAKLDSTEMYSRGMVRGQIYSTNVASAVHQLRLHLPDSTRAFKGDEVMVFVQPQISGGGPQPVANEDTTSYTVDLTGTMRHVIVARTASVPSGANASDIYDLYVAHGATVVTHGGATGISAAQRTVSAGAFTEGTQLLGIRDIGGTAGRLTMLNRVNPDTTMYAMIYCPLDSLIPAGSFVVDARFNAQVASNWFTAITDTAGVILMSNPQDNQWYRRVGNSQYSRAYQDWTYQRADSSLHAWDPPLDDRVYFDDWGSVFQWTREQRKGATPYPSPTAFGSPAWMGWRLAKLLQPVVDGEADNNGFLLFRMTNGSTDATTLAVSTIRAWDHSQATQRPFFTLSYIEGYEAEPFIPDGGRLIVSFSTDDGHLVSNDAWSAVADSLGFGYTAYVNQRATQADYYTAGGNAVANLARWIGRGVPIGSHARIHQGFGVAQYDTIGIGDMRAGAVMLADTSACGDWATVYAAATTSMDSLLIDLQRCWLEELTGVAVRSFAAPNNRWAQQGVFGVDRAGYANLRVGGVGLLTLPHYDYGAFPYWTDQSAISDTARTTFVAHNPFAPVNSLMFPTNINMQQIVGPTTAPGTPEGPVWTESKIRSRIRWAAYRHIGRGSPVVHWFTHATRYSGAYDVDPWHINPEELAYIMTTVRDSLGAVIMTAEEVADWKLSRTVPVAVPAAWGQTYKATREEGFFRRLKWVHAVQMYGGVPRKPS